MSPRAKQLSVIGISWFLTLVFLASGGTKLAGLEMHVDSFTDWGFPLWFMYLTGALEVTAAVLIFLPPARFLGAMLIIVIMIGATATHAWHQEWEAVWMPWIPLALAAYVAYHRRPGQQRPGKGGTGKRSLRRPIA